MPRRKRFFSGPKRRSVKMGPVKSNYKGVLPTSTSIGGRNARINMSSRGIRSSTKIPGTNIRTESWWGPGRRKSSVPEIQQEQARKKGCLKGCSPILVILVIAAVLLIVSSQT
jgi:hypothetical protein